MVLRTRYLLRAQTGFAALALVVGVLGCQSEDDRFDYFMRRADAARHEVGGEETAVIELLNALQIRPDDAQVNFLLGEVRQNQGLFRDAIFYFEEAHYLDPAHTRAAVALALLLRSSEPERAAAILASALEQEPENAWIHAATAELALDRESPAAALAAARRAVELDPDLAFAQSALGRAHMGQISVAQLLGERARPVDFLGAEAAFARYAELTGPREEWNSLIERARVLAAWPGHSQQALAMFRKALAAADESAPRSGRLRVATHVLEFARARKDDELRTAALERLIELEPEYLAYWDELAAVREVSGGAGGSTLEQLLAEQPDNPEAHLRYAGYLRASDGPEAAIAHLEEFSENDALRPTLLGALIEIYDATGRREESKQARFELEDEYPFHPVTLLTRAKRAFRRGQIKEAAQDLRDLTQNGGQGEAEGMLAVAEFALGNNQAALDASFRATEINPRFESGLLEIRAKAAYALGNCPVAGRAMLRLLSEDRLDERQQVLLARCLYQSDRAGQGRRLLRKLLAAKAPPLEAVLEFSRREMQSAGQRELLRRKLEQALLQQPGHAGLQRSLAEARRLDGLTEEGIAGLDQALEVAGDASKPDLLLLRAQLHADAGNPDAALRDAELAISLDPSLHGGLRFYISVLTQLGRYDDAIAALEARQKAGSLGADRTALLGRLYLRTGNRAAGRDALLRAYQLGCRIPDVLTTLAFMLATDGEHLAIALQLARLAVEADNESANSLDTLGWVHLKLGQPEKALAYFDQAVEEGPAPKSKEHERAVAAFHFRRGLALQALGRDSEARAAFEHAHTLDPTRPLAPSTTPNVPSQPTASSAAAEPS